MPISIIIVIPARYASVRLPAKPLLRETGQYLIEHVYRGAQKSKLATSVIVATDDQRIFQAVREFGGKVEMTSDQHQSGTDRMAEVASHISGNIFVNVQGDEPEITGEAIDQAIQLMLNNPQAMVGTLVYPLEATLANNPNIVKVVCDKRGYAMYFSRAMIPFVRDTNKTSIGYLGHIGIYAYRREFLLKYPNLPASQLEKIEKLEQLRVLENGYPIVTTITNYRSRGIDTPEDYSAFVARFRANKQPQN